MAQKLSLKLVVDKEKNRVVFAESNKDFVDVLFSFLTLPLGTIIRLLPMKSSLGCFSKLYDSIENLDIECLQTKACKNMLLQPRSASEEHCEDLKVHVNDIRPRNFYLCQDWDCRLCSSVPFAQCSCGKILDYSSEWTRVTSIKDGVFVKGGARRFMVTDDFQVMAGCTAHILSLLSKLGVREAAILEEMEVEIGKQEVLSLLERSLLSNTPLSEMFLGWKQVTSNSVEEIKRKDISKIKVEISDTSTVSNTVQLKLFINKDNEEVLYAEAKDDFINLLSSFLTFPLGTIVKLLDRHSSLSCADNLYRSVEFLIENEGEFLNANECKNMLLNPKLASFFGCSNQILKIDEMPPKEFLYDDAYLSPVNPKLPCSGKEAGGGFVKVPGRFMVTGDLVVTTLSPAAVIKLINRLQVPDSRLEERIINLGEAEALNLLKASLVSHNALSSAFSSVKTKRSKRYFV